MIGPVSLTPAGGSIRSSTRGTSSPYLRSRLDFNRRLPSMKSREAMGSRVVGLAMLASALTAYAALRPDPAAPDPELLRALEELDARLDRSAFVDLADFERDALEVR